MKINEKKCSKCDTHSTLIKGMCTKHYQQLKNKQRYEKNKQESKWRYIQVYPM